MPSCPKLLAAQPAMISARWLRSGRPSLVPAACRRAARWCSGSSVRLGDAAMKLRQAASPELVPRPAPSRGVAWSDSPDSLVTLQWLMKKQLLQQDAMLLGGHVPTLRSLACRFCEMTQQEAELVAISRDTTESDLKQRREICGGSVVYSDQPVVQAGQSNQQTSLQAS